MMRNEISPLFYLSEGVAGGDDYRGAVALR